MDFFKTTRITLLKWTKKTIGFKVLQSNLDYPDLDYPDLDYPDYSIIRTFFSGPIFFMNIN